MDWDSVKVFHALAERRTVRAAAAALGVHHATVIRRVERLEAAMRVRLFDRRPDGYALTQAGEELAGPAASIAALLNAAGRKLSGRDEAMRGTLTVTMPEPVASVIFAPVLPRFLKAYPGLELRLRTGMAFADIARGEADIAIRMDNNPPDGLVGKRLFAYCQAVYAAPDYLRAHDLKNHPERARFLQWDAGAAAAEWTKRTEFPRVPVWGYFPDLHLQAAAARSAIGLALLPCLLGDRDPGLTRAGGGQPIRRRDIWLLTHRDLRRTARVRAFMEFAEETIRRRKDEITGARRDGS